MSELRFDGRVVVVTGAGRNLGREYALALAARGASVVVNDLGVAISDSDGSGEAPPRSPACDVVDEIHTAGGVAVADTNSVATRDGGGAIIATALDTYGRIDVVINNAGVVRAAPFADLTDDLLDPVIDSQIRSLFYVTQPAWRAMASQGYGRVVNVSSGAALGGTPGHVAYGAAKMAVIGATRQLAAEGEPLGIKVNVVAPYAKTRPGTPFGPIPWSDSLAAWLSPELLAPLVTLLAHEDCPVTGDCFAAGGGLVSRVLLSTTPGLVDRAMTPESLLGDWATVMDDTGADPATYATSAVVRRMFADYAGAVDSGRDL